MDTVDRELGAIARPGAVHFVTLLPKTRSGKLLRRSIQALAEGRDPGDLTTIEDPGALEQIRAALATPATTSTPRARRCGARGQAIMRDLLALAMPNARRSTTSARSPRRRAAARPARRRHARRRGRERPLRLGGRRRPRTAGCCYAAGDPHFVDDDAQRAEAVPGDAVRRGAAASSASAISTAQVALLCASHSGEPRHVDGGRRHAGAGGQHGGRPAMRHARAGLLRGARRGAAAAAVFAARAQLLGQAQRHARVLRPVRPAEGRLSRLRPSAAAGDPRVRSRTSPASPEAELVAGIDGCSAPNYAVPLARARARPSRGWRDGATTPSTARRRAMLADAMTAHPGDGVGRRPQRPRADAGRPRRLGDQDRRRGRAGDRHAQPRARHRRSRSPTAQKRGLHPAIVAVLDQLGLARRRRSARACRRGATPTVRNYRGIATGDVRAVGCPGQTLSGAATARAEPHASAT